MTGEQQQLFADSWVRRDELLDLAAMVKAAWVVGQLGEAEYDRTTAWPTMFEHKSHGTCLAFLQRRVDTGCSCCAVQFRFVFTDRRGYVVDESAWCSTEGGARGYRNRARA